VANIDSAIEGGITYLRWTQQPDGSFTGDSSPTVQPFTPTRTYHTTFLPALVLGALQGINEAQAVRQPLAAWLMTQRNPAGSFNYWAANAPERHTMPYPDDLDDTFCALIALLRHDPALVDGATLSSAVKLLLVAEAQVGGPYRTWLVGLGAPATWQDIDLAVNCNIACFLRAVAEPLPNLTALMDQAIDTQTFTSPYYPSELPVLYYMARAYSGAKRQALTRYIQSRRPNAALGMALRISALLALEAGGGVQPAIDRLLALQQKNGSWPAAAYCLDAKRGDTIHYHGAAALTTAFALEALHGYYSQQQPGPAKPMAARGPAYTRIITQAKAALAVDDPELQIAAAAMVDHVAAHDVSLEIAMMPQLFHASLAAPPATTASQLQQLSLANLFGWMAYTIFDDFLDEEGKPPLLPVATVALRRAMAAFMNAAPNIEFRKFVSRTFDTIDAANAWETTHCRFNVTKETITIGPLPAYHDLRRIAERSYGHMLTPLAIVSAAGHPLRGTETIHIQNALHHYLIARQLQDDVYDWQEDLRAGRITAVVAELLRTSRLKPGEHRFDAIMPRLQRQFWQVVLPVLCTRTGRHLAKARAAAGASGLFISDSPLHKLFDRIDVVMAQTRAEQTKAAEFMTAYKKPLA
jgi:hypothetical protein